MKEHNFEPGQLVLVRDGGVWWLKHFSHYRNSLDGRCYITIEGNSWKHCIPFPKKHDTILMRLEHAIREACHFRGMAEQTSKEIRELHRENVALERELRGTNKILVRLDKAGSWGVMVNANELQEMESAARMFDDVSLELDRHKKMVEWLAGELAELHDTSLMLVDGAPEGSNRSPYWLAKAEEATRQAAEEHHERA